MLPGIDVAMRTSFLSTAGALAKVLVLVAAVTASSHVLAAACDFPALVRETDKKGLTVRQHPGVKSKAVGRLPPVFLTRDRYRFPVKVVVNVKGSSDGWIEIDDARDNETLTGMPARKMYQGRGWVSGRKITVKSQGKAGHERPESGSRVTVKYVAGSAFDNDEMVHAAQLVGCLGKWALVEFDLNKMAPDAQESLQIDAQASAGLPMGRFRAWVNQICGIEETSCDGLGAEEPVPTR